MIWRAPTAALAVAMTACTSLAPHQPPFETDVFVAGDDGYAVYRIPAIVKSAGGVLLAFCEGRVTDAADFGDIDIVLKRSDDGGQTWSPVQLVVANGVNTAGNPTPVVDRRTGRVVLLFNRAPAEVTVDSIRGGEHAHARTGWVTTSDDDGHSWSTPREITSETKDPSWPYLSFGPVHAIQLRRGPHTGRLVFPANHSTPEGADHRWLGAHLVYSDDGGETFHLGGFDHPKQNVVNPNESTVVELTDGRLLINTRDMGGAGPGNRGVTYSSDGGETFDTPFAPFAAFDIPIVQGALLRVSARDSGDALDHIVFSGPSHLSARQDLRVHSSFDEGASWRTGSVIHQGFAAYSDMVALDDAVGVLFEAGSERLERITFQRVQPKR